MQVPTDLDPPCSSWSGGLPLCRDRPLTPRERQWAERTAFRLWAEGWLLLGSGPGLFIASLLYWLRDPRADSSWAVLQMGVLGGLLILGLLLSPGGWVYLRRARELRVALVQGQVDRFGRPEGEEVTPRTRFVKLRFDRGVSGPLSWFESVHGSGLLLASDGRLPKGYCYAPPTTPTKGPGSAAIAAEWAEPLYRGDPHSPEIDRRELTPAEVAEVVRAGLRLLLLPGLFLFLAGVVLTLMLASTLSRVPGPRNGSELQIASLLVGLAGAHFLVRFRRFRLLRRDVDAGMVLRVRMLFLFLAEGESPSPGQSAPVAEYLLHSRILWTVDDRPAGWRAG